MGHGLGQRPSRNRALLFPAIGSQRKPSDQANELIGSSEVEEAAHWEPLAGAADQSLEGRGQGLGLVTESQPNANLSPIDAKDTAGGWNGHRKSVNRER